MVVALLGLERRPTVTLPMPWRWRCATHRADGSRALRPRADSRTRRAATARPRAVGVRPVPLSRDAGVRRRRRSRWKSGCRYELEAPMSVYTLPPVGQPCACDASGGARGCATVVRLCTVEERNVPSSRVPASDRGSLWPYCRLHGRLCRLVRRATPALTRYLASWAAIAERLIVEMRDRWPRWPLTATPPWPRRRSAWPRKPSARWSRSVTGRMKPRALKNVDPAAVPKNDPGAL